MTDVSCIFSALRYCRVNERSTPFTVGPWFFPPDRVSSLNGRPARTTVPVTRSSIHVCHGLAESQADAQHVVRPSVRDQRRRRQRGGGLAVGGRRHAAVVDAARPVPGRLRHEVCSARQRPDAGRAPRRQ